MLPEKEYFVFSKKVSKLLKTCFLCVKHPGDETFSASRHFGMSESDVYRCGGQSSLTRENKYYFNKAEAQKHKEALLQICASLPKCKTVISGTAGTIAYTDLLPDMKTNINALTKSCELADKFIALLSINGIGYAKDFVGSGDFKAAPVQLSYRYVSQVNPDLVK